jgi:methane/ammonia monooxygenase subunit B
MMKRLALIAVLGLATIVSFAPAASAHGEKSQEAFLRMRTIGWTDVVFSGGTRNAQGDIVVPQGGTFTIKGVAKLMEAWPDTLAAGIPRIGYINVATQGPCVGMLERTVNGVSTPGRIELVKGRHYAFEEKMMGRRVGRWHVHPTFAVKGAGTLLGPGQWVTVTPHAFQSPVKLYNGETINIENYQLSAVWILQVIGFLLGLIWIVWWTGGSMIANPKWGPKWHRTVTNPAVTLSIPLNDDGVAVGLNKKADHRFINLMAIITVIFLLIGWVWQAAAFPVKIPQQVVQFEPPATELDKAPPLAEVNAQSAKYDYRAKVLSLVIDAKNVSNSPIQLAQYVTSTLTFVNPAIGSPSGQYQSPLKVSPSGAIQPGQKMTLNIDVSGGRFDEEHLLPTGESQLTISGLLVFQDAAGVRNSAEFEEPLQPRYTQK